MNFNLKATDSFESSGNGKSGKFTVKIVDAKFALPKGPESEARGFVCLDMPDFPGEHDDVTITFESENGKLGQSVTFIEKFR